MFANKDESKLTLLNVSNTGAGNNADKGLFDTLKVLFPDYQKLYEKEYQELFALADKNLEHDELDVAISSLKDIKNSKLKNEQKTEIIENLFNIAELTHSIPSIYQFLKTIKNILYNEVGIKNYLFLLNTFMAINKNEDIYAKNSKIVSAFSDEKVVTTLYTNKKENIEKVLEIFKKFELNKERSISNRDFNTITLLSNTFYLKLIFNENIFSTIISLDSLLSKEDAFLSFINLLIDIGDSNIIDNLMESLKKTKKYSPSIQKQYIILNIYILESLQDKTNSLNLIEYIYKILQDMGRNHQQDNPSYISKHLQRRAYEDYQQQDIDNYYPQYYNYLPLFNKIIDTFDNEEIVESIFSSIKKIVDLKTKAVENKLNIKKIVDLKTKAVENKLNIKKMVDLKTKVIENKLKIKIKSKSIENKLKIKKMVNLKIKVIKNKLKINDSKEIFYIELLNKVLDKNIDEKQKGALFIKILDIIESYDYNFLLKIADIFSLFLSDERILELINKLQSENLGSIIKLFEYLYIKPDVDINSVLDIIKTIQIEKLATALNKNPKDNEKIVKSISKLIFEKNKDEKNNIVDFYLDEIIKSSMEESVI